MNELTERYVGATLRTVPEAKRDGIEAELRASIADAVEARVAAGEPTDAAAETVLTELGDPDRLAASYSGRPAYVIGPDHYYTWRRLLGVLLVRVVPIVIVIVAAIKTIAGDPLGSIIGGSISIGVTLIVQLVFWTTLGFVVLERTGTRIETPKWSLARLPSPPIRRQVRLGDTLANIGFTAAVMFVLSLFAQTTVWPIIIDGDEVALIDPSLWTFWLPYFIVLLAGQIVLAWTIYLTGRWTRSLATINLALNAIFAVPAIYLLAAGRILNPEFFAQLGDPNAARAGGLTVLVTAAVVGIISLYDVIDGYRKAGL